MSIRFTAEVIFWLSAAALVYTYAGYPFLIAAVSMLRPKRVRRDKYEPSVTVIIAAYNEERACLRNSRTHWRWIIRMNWSK